MSVGLSTAAMAQETSSGITGSVVGPQGAPAAGTVITVKHVPTGSVKTITVNADGQFSLSGLRVGLRAVSAVSVSTVSQQVDHPCL